MQNIQPLIDAEIAHSSLIKGLACGKLVMKLASSAEELDAALKMRFEIFNKELGEGIPANESIERDVDHYDTFCDHLLSVTSSGRVIGCYRLLPGSKKPKEGYYTESEFDLSKLKLDDNNTVELGRACIEPEYRKQSTLLSLFWGLHQYVLLRKAQFLVGCASLPAMSPDDAEATYALLQQENRVHPDTPVSPLKPNQFKGNATKGKAQIPPLLALYLEFGTKIMGRPAYDPVFRCFDLPVMFDMDHLSQWGIELLERFDKRLSYGQQS